jgi:hypothetical protein
MPVHRDHHEAQVAARAERLEPFVTVVADDAQRVPDAQTEPSQPVHQAVDPIVVFGPRPRAELVDDREVVPAIDQTLLQSCNHVEPPGSVASPDKTSWHDEEVLSM